jgi:hypothetical protein
MSRKGAAQIPQVGILLEKTRTLVGEIEGAYQGIETDHRTPSLRDCYAEFSTALIEYRDSVLYDLVSASFASAGDNSGKVGKTTEWGGKSPWKKPPPSTAGSSTQAGVILEENDGIEQKFEEDSDDTERAVEKEAELEPVKKKKKKMVVIKKVVKKVRKAQTEDSGETRVDVQERTTLKDSHITEKDMSALRSVLYYVSEVETDASKSLAADISASLESLTAKTRIVGTIVDVAAMDEAQTGKSVSDILGLSDGVIIDSCTKLTVLAAISPRGQETDLHTAVKGIRNVLTWTKCSSTTCSTF